MAKQRIEPALPNIQKFSVDRNLLSIHIYEDQICALVLNMDSNIFAQLISAADPPVMLSHVYPHPSRMTWA